jgi:uncharacterized protein YbjT (DUF2867 family)
MVNRGPVLVTGALGNVGGATVTALLATGARVRAAGLDANSVARRFPGAEAVRLDFRDPETFRSAVVGCPSMLLLRPSPIARVKPTLNRLIDVAGENGMSHVVFSSVQGADTNRIVPHHRVEEHLRASGLGWTMLRPGFFAQNLIDAYRLDIRDDHRVFVPAAEGRVAFIDVTDIGEIAASIFSDPASHRGQGYQLTGPEAVTFAEVAALLTKALGRSIRYEPASALGYACHLHRRGLPLPQVAVQTVLHLGLRRGDASIVDPTVQRLLGRPARPLDQFISEHRETWV